jgi:hypothetical protein
MKISDIPSTGGGGNWLKAADLDGKSAKVKIVGAEMQMLRKYQSDEEEERLVLSFDGSEKQLDCNVTNRKMYLSLCAEAGISDSSEGLSVILYTEMTDKGAGIRMRSAVEEIAEDTPF